MPTLSYLDEQELARWGLVAHFQAQQVDYDELGRSIYRNLRHYSTNGNLPSEAEVVNSLEVEILAYRPFLTHLGRQGHLFKRHYPALANLLARYIVIESWHYISA